MITCFLFAILFVVEFSIFLNSDVERELFVDEGLNQRLAINLDITFPSLPCSCRFFYLKWGFIRYRYLIFFQLVMSLDAVDSSGQALLDIQSELMQQRLNRRGDPISQAEMCQYKFRIYLEL